MASSFPGAIDNFTDPLANSSLASPSHSTLHSDINDAVEKIETYMGLVQVLPSAVSGTGVALSSRTVVLTAAPDPFITCFTSLYDDYRIVLVLTAFSGGASSVTMRTASGTTPNTTAANYRNFGFEGSYSTSTVTGVNNNGATAGWNVGRVDGTTQFSTFICDVQSPFAARNTAFASNFRDGSVSGVQNGYLQVTTSYDGFNVRIGGTNTMTGTIRVYGYRN